MKEEVSAYRDQLYWIAGEVNVPEDKKDELNAFVMELLDKCGIRKTEEMELAGKKFIVVDKVSPDAEGMVKFDYSIFDKYKRRVGRFDTKTCKLYADDIGYDAYCYVMKLIMILQEAYTNGHCYVMKRNKPLISAYDCICVLKSVLGRDFQLNNRGKMWEMFLFLKKQEGVESITVDDVENAFPFELCKLNINQFVALLHTKKMNFDREDRFEYIHNRSEIPEASFVECMEYLFRIIKELVIDQDDELRKFLTVLLQSYVKERKEFAKRQDSYGIIAELSLNMLPPDIVCAYAHVKNTAFWEMWDSFGFDGYVDVEKDDYSEVIEKSAPYSFYRAIRRKSEDEFLESWDGESLYLSDRMRDCLEEWSKCYREAPDIEEGMVEMYLADIIKDMYDIWRCRFVDKSFVIEFLKNKHNTSYRKALVTLRTYMNKGMEYFPELTEYQAIRWMVSHYRRSDSVMMSAFQSLMINHSQRKVYFGF